MKILIKVFQDHINDIELNWIINVTKRVQI